MASLRVLGLGVSVALLGVALSAGCGGSANSGGGAGSGGSGGSAGSAGNGGSAGNAGGAGNAGTSGSGGTAGVPNDCQVPSDCVVMPISCCGSCGVPSRGDAQAVRKDQAQAVSQAACGEGSGCPACAAPPDPTLLATCEAGQCTLVDLQEDPITECMTGEDCRIRTDTCCECGGPTDEGHLIAIRKDGNFESLVCDPNTGCDDCIPDYGTSGFVQAECIKGRCSAQWYYPAD
ncbi:MAG: hypothetical protein H6718_00815 [Polyangiaceae bacterium]|nr:hypothetical protein [Polyangiaceae bacterium]MCB9607839.1 hypothetical protein [Polyangiaceae bacterium]